MPTTPPQARDSKDEDRRIRVIVDGKVIAELVGPLVVRMEPLRHTWWERLRDGVEL